MTFIAATVPWPHNPTSDAGEKYRTSNETTPGFPAAAEVGVRKTMMGWLKPFANLRQSSWVRVLSSSLDWSRKTIVAGFPPNASWLNALAIANGYDPGVDMKATGLSTKVFTPSQLPLGGYL